MSLLAQLWLDSSCHADSAAQMARPRALCPMPRRVRRLARAACFSWRTSTASGAPFATRRRGAWPVLGARARRAQGAQGRAAACTAGGGAARNARRTSMTSTRDVSTLPPAVLETR
jgi:hypothetical protein